MNNNKNIFFCPRDSDQVHTQSTNNTTKMQCLDSKHKNLPMISGVAPVSLAESILARITLTKYRNNKRKMRIMFLSTPILFHILVNNETGKLKTDTKRQTIPRKKKI